jgi:hypothetical protein
MLFDVNCYSGMNLNVALSSFFDVGRMLNESNPWSNSTLPIHSLVKRLGFWKALGANKQVLSWLAYGLPLRFVVEPPHLDFANHDTFTDNEWSDEEMEKQIRLGRVFIVPHTFAKHIYPLGVQVKTKPDGSVKYRRTDDCRLLNSRLANMAHTLETVNILPNIVQKDDEMFSVDLSEFYYQFSMEPSALPWLCFRTVTGKLMCTGVLPMGLKPATFFTTKINRPIVKFFRILLLRVLNYLDDFFGGDSSQQALAALMFVKNILSALGFVINESKSSVTCSKMHECLGILICSRTRMWKIPDRKVTAIMRLVDHLLLTRSVVVSNLRSYIGILLSVLIACPLLILYLRSFFLLLPKGVDNEHDVLFLEEPHCDDLVHIRQLVEFKNGQCFDKKMPDAIMTVDTSETASGGKLCRPLLNTLTGVIALPDELCGTSSTLRELWGILQFLLLWRNEVSNSTLETFCLNIITDSKAGVANLNNMGSSTIDCTTISKRIYSIASSLNIQLQVTWTPRNNLADVDALSKTWQLCDIRFLCPVVFLKIQSAFPNTPILLPEFNKLKLLFPRRLRSQIPFNVVVIHPVWFSHSWWPSLVVCRADFVDVGTYPVCFPLSSSLCPQWAMHASLI